MAGSLNKVMLIGNLGKDPEVKTLQSGAKVVNFRIATSDSWKDKTTGERQERTEWHSIVIWNEGLGKIAEQYLKKGSKVYVEGSLQTRKWQDQGGADRYSTEIVLQKFNGALTLLDGRRDGAGGGRGDDESRTHDSDNRSSGGGAARKSGQTLSEELDDEIPF